LLTPEDTAEEAVPPRRLGILISGRGSNGMAIIRAVAEGHLPGCEVGLVISNIPGAPGIEAAKAFGIPVITLEGRGRDQRDHEEAITALLRKFRVDLVCLAGYRRVLSGGFIRDWHQRIVNIHASLLPAFSGSDPSKQALDFGAQITGCTVHFAEETGYGPIILQRVVPILDEDEEQDLSQRLLLEQQATYVEAIRRVVSGEYQIHGKRYVRIPPPPELAPDEELEPMHFEPHH
jgi:phosphoribosylglycinamide formyltransferase-1